MLGTEVKKDIYRMINKNVRLNHPKDGPIDCEIKDVKGGMVYFETTVGNLSSMTVEQFEKLLEK